MTFRALVGVKPSFQTLAAAMVKDADRAYPKLYKLSFGFDGMGDLASARSQRTMHQAIGRLGTAIDHAEDAAAQASTPQERTIANDARAHLVTATKLVQPDAPVSLDIALGTFHAGQAGTHGSLNSADPAAAFFTHLAMASS